MKVRQAIETDAEGIRDIWNAVIRHSLITFNASEKSTAEVADLIGERTGQTGGFLVAVDDDSLLGFATYAQFRGGVGYARTMEHTIYLDPSARGRGAGRALMLAVEEDAAQKGAHTMFAGVSSANSEGRAFHAAMGYEEVAVLPEVGWKWDRWLDLHLMQKRLSSPQRSR